MCPLLHCRHSCQFTNTVHWPTCTVLYSCTEVHLWLIKASHNTYWLQCQHSCQSTMLMYCTLAVTVHLIGQGALYNDMLCAFITKPTLVPIILLFPWLLCAHYCTVDTHANLLSVLWGLFELCVYTNTVHWPRCTVLYSCTEFPLWPIRASHPSNQWHHRKCVTDRQTNRQTDRQTNRQTYTRRCL